ncbi:NIPSNAP family containing protein [Flavobacteriaceae bacterium TP-CH-4]|uniref:NIPSNAP family containing protein n=1 Tax=Pelagihabitans pacificus TaxID=2696054 RepID=A0A967E5C9_9FLAO|nr:NIPSNAP family protein [Pelagihabitans pacificus]NHF59312.1 NIPSNAP family containing protein [Pelagihabitans pacificus]
MKTLLFSFTLLLFFSKAVLSQGTAREYYQLKIYSFETEEQVQTTDAYLENAYLPALKRMGIGPVGVFKPRPTDSVAPKKTYVLIPFDTLDELSELENQLLKDMAYSSSGKDYLEAPHDRPPYHRIEGIILKAFVDMPEMEASKLSGPREDRVYELRSYESATEAIYRNKVDMFNAGGEIKLFEKLGFNAVFYAEVVSGCKMPNLMYMTTHANKESRDANWKSFVDAPEWNTLKAMPKYQNNVSHIDIFLLYPTAYSDY